KEYTKARRRSGAIRGSRAWMWARPLAGRFRRGRKFARRLLYQNACATENAPAAPGHGGVSNFRVGYIPLEAEGCPCAGCPAAGGGGGGGGYMASTWITRSTSSESSIEPLSSARFQLMP